jgi:hypothetical protein
MPRPDSITVSDTSADAHTSAGRLHGVLDALRQYPTQTAPLIAAWARVLHVDRTDVPAVLQRIAQVGLLVKETRSDIARHIATHRQAWYLEVFPAVEALVGSLNLAEQVNAANRLPPTVFDRLWAAHMALDDRRGHAGPRSVRASTLARFRERADALLQEILTEQALSDQLRRLLVEHLEAIRRALLNYDINGVAELDGAVTFAMGMGLRERATLERDLHGEGSATAPVVVQRTWALTRRLARVVDWARTHPAETSQIVLGIAQVAIGVAQLAAGAPSPGVTLVMPGGAPTPSTPVEVTGPVTV